MKREIKFRAWDTDAKEMFYSTGIHQILYGGASDDIGLGIKSHWSVKNSERGWHRQRNFSSDYKDGIIILLQSTGLLDKDGKEIYEGDIVQLDDVVCPVTWEDGGFQMITDAQQGRSAVLQDRLKRFEIIGNIYQNPELV